MEEEFGCSESSIETVLNKSFGLGGFTVNGEVRKRSVEEPVGDTASAHRLLPHTRNHLTDVDVRSYNIYRERE